MIFYEKATALGLLTFCIPVVIAAYFHFIQDKQKTAIILLVSSAFILRLFMMAIDPYLHDWDERYHALVAKHMMNDPFKPMLFLQHIIPYNLYDWGYNHIWVHKQPLFLWQMALSMKMFGINLIALRLPSAVMGSIMVWLTYDLTRKWLSDNNVAFTAAVLSCLSYYILELTSGVISLEHNDLAFTFYMTCCLWAFTKYVSTQFSIKWAVLIGIFAGMAILNKWLVGLLIFGGWGLYLLQEGKFDIKKYLHLIYGALAACVIFIPWQIYILEAFPAESAIAFEYNRKHMSEDLGHPGNSWFHLAYLPHAYHTVLLGFGLIGLISALVAKKGNYKMTISFVAMMIVIFGFFSLFVATKMPAFVFPVSAIVFGFMGVGIITVSSYITKNVLPLNSYGRIICIVVVIAAGVFSLKPWLITKFRAVDNHARNNEIFNTKVYKGFDSVTEDYVILNTRPYDNIEMMFYKDVLAYHWYPPAHQLDSLQNLGYKFAAFQYPGDQQQLPDYISGNKEIVVLQDTIK